MSDRFHRLEDVVLDAAFPDLDLALRRGRHVDRDDAEWYALLGDAQDHLEAFYRRYGCELVHKSDGYFYLLPTNERLGRRQLSTGEMLVGQSLALLYLDPKAAAEAGVVTRERVLEHLAGVVGAETLIRVLHTKRRKYDERVAADAVRHKVDSALRRLASLGFVDVLDDGHVRLRAALLRFAEPVRGTSSPEANLERLIEAGEVVFAERDADGDEGDDDEDGGDEGVAGGDDEDGEGGEAVDAEGTSEHDANGEDRTSGHDASGDEPDGGATGADS